MAGVHRLEHVQGLRAADLADDDPIGPHAQGVADELADLDLAHPFDVRRPGLERHDVVLLELKLRRVLDRDDALAGRDEGAHRVQRRRLAGARTTRDQDVELALHARGDELRRARSDGAERDQVVDRVRIARELPDRHRRAAEGEWRDDRVDTAAVRQARIDHRRRLVDPAADLRDDLVDDPHHVRLVDEADVGALELAVPLDVHLVRGVDHDLRHGLVAEQRLDRPVAENVVRQLTDDLAPLVAGQRRAVEDELLGDGPVDLVGEILVVGLVELGPELRDARVVDLGLQLRVRIDRKRSRCLGLGSACPAPGRRRCRRRPGAGDDREAPSVAQLLARLSRLRGLACFSAGVMTAIASSFNALANSEPGSERTAGVPRLTAIGTIRSDGIAAWTVTLRAASTSRTLRPTFEFARFST